MSESIKELWVRENCSSSRREVYLYREPMRSCLDSGDTLRRFVPDPVWTLYDQEKPPEYGWYLCEVPELPIMPLAMCQFYGGHWWFGLSEMMSVRRYTPVPSPPEWMP